MPTFDSAKEIAEALRKSKLKQVMQQANLVGEAADFIRMGMTAARTHMPEGTVLDTDLLKLDNKKLATGISKAVAKSKERDRFA